MDPAAVVTPLMLQIFNKFRVKGLPSLKFWLSFYQTRITFMISPLTSGQVSVCTPGLQVKRNSITEEEGVGPIIICVIVSVIMRSNKENCSKSNSRQKRHKYSRWTQWPRCRPHCRPQSEHQTSSRHQQSNAGKKQNNI